MKNLKSLAIVMSALLAAQGGISPAVFATKPRKEMEQKIQNQFLQTIFFRPDLVGVLKTSLKEEDIPKSFRTPEFLKLLKEEGILKDESEGGKKEEVETEEKLEEENREKKPNLREIIEEDNLELLQKEFRQKPNTEIEDSFFEVENMKIPILHYCVMKKPMLLISKGADINAKNNYEMSPLWIAQKHGYKFIEHKKEEVETEENREKKPNLREIIKEDNLELLQKEFRQKPNTEIEDSFFEVENMKIPILHYCVMKKAMRCFKFLVLNGADPSLKLRRKYIRRYEWDCMSIAICFGEWEMMKILEERGINKLNNPSVWEAAALTHRNNLLKLFISNKDQIDNFGECLNKALFSAVNGNNLKALILLIQNGADINAKDKNGETPLHVAAKNDAKQVAEILISKGADIDARDRNGETPLHDAARYDADKVAELLISKGADINAKNNCGMSPLWIAQKHGYKFIEQQLISKGAK